MSWKFNPFTTKLDYFEDTSPTLIVDSAKRLKDYKICSEDISALQLVVAVNDSDIEIAQPNTFKNAKVLGVALVAGSIGAEIEILSFGKLEDSFFNFSVNDNLFLKLDGTITDVPPEIPDENYSTNIGYSLGVGAIFININEPIEL